MPRRNLASFTVACLAAVAFAACPEPSPIAPGARPDGVGARASWASLLRTTPTAPRGSPIATVRLYISTL